jgi:hypothetical protein
MNTLKLTVTIDADGRQAADMLDDLAIDAEGGMFDQALLNLLRDHLRRMGDFRDWRIVSARVDVQEEIP